MLNKLLTITIVVLVLVALSMGYLIYTKGAGKNTNTFDSTNTTTVDTNVSPSPSTSADRVEILNFPDKNASEEEKSKHADLVSKNAVKADYLNLTGCQADPVALAVNKGAIINAKNDGDSTITINYAGKELTIEKNSQVQINTDNFFEGTIGDHGYGCSEVNTIAGIVKILGQ